MNSRISIKIRIRSLMLVSAALLINANTVLAANRVGDAQMQARDLLSGSVGEKPKSLDKSLAISADRHKESYPDSQEQARRLILGKPSFESAAGQESAAQSKTNVAARVSARHGARVHADAQDLARRLILGDAGSGR
jgi:hypothetical protein